ncbi:hypothetical protein EDD15DRAFT_2207691 [Pisolithus albus]|nr:hypothetical protein EDD15DRAFT_2207691 [Pisolithus albus]
MSDRQHAMTPYPTGRAAPGPTSYHTGAVHASTSSYPSAGTYNTPVVDLRSQSTASGMDIESTLGGTYRNMHPFMPDPGMVPRPQSAMHSGHTRSGSIVPGSSSRGYPNQAGPSSRTLPHGSPYPTQVSQYPANSQDIMTMQEEINMLRRRVKELEMVNEHGRLRIQDLERELAGGSTIPSLTQGPSSVSTHPQVQRTPMPPSVQTSWRARTDARVRLLCSLNRAGNALCAWHDSRRERRTYPPRMAPPGYLNCGCSFEEALFEESLSRHGIGSYHPGESVRMDPALRNPLLRLLQTRYGYQDGDFERDPKTGEWVQGEGNVLWERKLSQGAMNVKKNRTEERR